VKPNSVANSNKFGSTGTSRLVVMTATVLDANLGALTCLNAYVVKTCSPIKEENASWGLRFLAPRPPVGGHRIDLFVEFALLHLTLETGDSRLRIPIGFYRQPPNPRPL
jgi:hypothetical protein